jgi:hypothetical protein
MNTATIIAIEILRDLRRLIEAALRCGAFGLAVLTFAPILCRLATTMCRRQN